MHSSDYVKIRYDIVTRGFHRSHLSSEGGNSTGLSLDPLGEDFEIHLYALLCHSTTLDIKGASYLLDHTTR